jgi:LysR family carnitine catabolism transcriptional activator
MSSLHHSALADRDAESMGIEMIELETFIAVARSGSFSHAAEQLHVSQPTVTGRVQRLETALGTRLLVRSTRKVETTAHGASLLAEASAALVGLRRIVLELREDARASIRRVIVASTPMLAATTLPPLIRDYRERFTDVQVNLLDLPLADALAAVEAGKADIALLAFEGDDPRFHAQPVWSEDMTLVVPPAHALAGLGSVTIEQIAPWPLLVIEQYGPMVTRIAEELARKGLAMAPPSVMTNLNTLLGMLDAGLGATLLPRSIARARGSAHTVIEIRGISLERTFSIVRAGKAELGTAAQSFIRFLRQAMG